MKFDSLGLPQDNGADDLQDSSRLAGILETFNWPKAIPIYLYVVNGKYVRHPKEYKYDFSRDQAVCLVAGLASAGYNKLVNEKYIQGKDFLTPSVKGHIERCKGNSASWLQDAWLWLDVLWSCYIKPDDEINQLLCILMLAPKQYIEFFLRNHKSWQQNLRSYWAGWRNEPELAEHMIDILLKI